MPPSADSSGPGLAARKMPRPRMVAHVRAGPGRHRRRLGRRASQSRRGVAIGEAASAALGVGMYVATRIGSVHGCATEASAAERAENQSATEP